MFTNSKSYAVRVGDVVVAPGETIGAEPASKKSTKRSKRTEEPTGEQLSEEDAS